MRRGQMEHLACMALVGALFLSCRASREERADISEQNVLTRHETDKLVRLLGTRQERSPHETLQVLHKDGRYIVSVLIGELSIVPVDWADKDDEYLREKSMHVIWCIRSLRSITGQRFEFKTSLNLTSQQAEFFTQEQAMPFFAEWMSRGCIYVSPVDVQEAVIKAWKGWVQEYGSSFRISEFKDYGAWYY